MKDAGLIYQPYIEMMFTKAPRTPKHHAYVWLDKQISYHAVGETLGALNRDIALKCDRVTRLTRDVEGTQDCTNEVMHSVR